MSSVPVTPPRRPPKRETGPTLDPAIERALAVSNFENNYNVEELVTSLSDKLIASSKADAGPFNPEPFLQTFSPALDRLLAQRKQVAERTKKMEADVKKAEREYGRRLRELDGGFETIGSSFSTLETKITDVGRTAVRIGEQLDSLHNTRSLAQSTSLLLSYYLSLSHASGKATPEGSQTPLDMLFATRTSREGRSRIAVILRRLMAVAKDVADNAASALIELNDPEKDAPAPGVVVKKQLEKEKADKIRDEVERYCEKFEKECLRLFDRSYRKGDPRMMAHCAKTLLDFNGGASCVQIYVNQHDFFISKDRVLEEARTLGEQGEDARGSRLLDLWLTITDPDTPPPTAELGLTALFREIRLTVSQEAQIIKAVFPNPGVVMQVFLQRVFAQVIQQHLEHLISRAASISTLATLRILHLTHSLCTALVEDLKAYDFSLGGSIATGIGSSSSNKNSNPGAVNGTPLAIMLDRALEEIFVPWLEGSRYLDIESKGFVEIYAALMTRFTKYHETVLKAKPNSLLDRVVNQLSSSNSTSNTSTASAAAAALFKYTGVSTHGNSASQPRSGADTPHGNRGGAATPNANQKSSLSGVNERMDTKTWAVDGTLTMETAEKILRWHAEAVGRCVELSYSVDVAKNAFALSKILAEAIGRTYVETALESALAKLDNGDSKIEPDLSTISVLRPADLICHLWQRYATTALLPLANSSAAIRREMGVFNNHNVVRMEGKVNSIVQRAIDAIISWLTFLLTKQKKVDFKPRNDDISFARTTTEPCTLCCEFLETVRDAVKESLSGKNAEAFLTEVGAAFHSLLLDHFKKFPVNPTGGLMLTKDLATYQETVATFRLPVINERFEMLRQLGNLFIVQPDVLKAYSLEGHLGRIDAGLLRPFLAQRSDYNSFSRSLAFDDGAIAAEEETVSGPMAGLSILKGSGSRLSGVAGSGMSKLRDMLKDLDNLAIEESKTPARVQAQQRAQGVSMYQYGMVMH